MNIVKKLFSREAIVEQATAEQPTEDELQRRLAEVEIAIAAGDGDLFALDDEKTELMRKLHVSRLAQQQRENAAYRARITDQADELRGRLNESLDELGDLVPRLLVACSHFDNIAAEVQEKGLGFTVGGPAEDIFCISHDFGSRVIAAIRDISPHTEWDYSHIGILGKGKKAEKPKIRRAVQPTMVAMQRDVYGNTIRPGTIDGNTGRPIHGNDTSGLFVLPPAS